MISAITHYNHGGIRVTSDELVIHDRRYLLTELDEVYIARGSTNLYGTGCLATSAGVFGVLATLSWQAPSLTAIVVTALALACLIGTPISYRLSRPAQELWALYHGHIIQLLWSRDAHTFNRIRWAICHARESRR